MRKIKVGVLGATRGLELIEADLLSHPQAELVAICENYRPLLESAIAKIRARGIPVEGYAEFDELLASDVEAIILANFANAHAPYAVRCLDAGKHVLSEVQPVQNLAEAVALCDAVERSGKVYNYAENYCFSASAFEMRRRYERGDIGEVTLVEGTFIHDCSSKWPRLTRGLRDHWRNLVPSTFYCSHSFGPMLYITGQRPLTVVGMELPRAPFMARHGARSGSAAVEIVQLANGGVGRSLHGNLKCAYTRHCTVYGQKGTMASDAYDLDRLRVQIEGERECRLANEDYRPRRAVLSDGRIGDEGAEPAGRPVGPVELFLGAIRSEAVAQKYAIDIYQALDMSLPGLLAYRSILAGSQPITVPDFRDRAEREKYRLDTACTDPQVAGSGQLLPTSRAGDCEVPEAVYQRVAERFLRGETD